LTLRRYNIIGVFQFLSLVLSAMPFAFHRFAMRRRDESFKRLSGPSLRAYAPYAAVHVDWYDDSENLPEDKVFYKNRQSGVNNW